MSRSGRVRKKSSKLMDFQSPDDIEATKSQKRTSHHKSPSTKRSLAASHIGAGAGGGSGSHHAKSSIKAYFQPIPKPNHNTALGSNHLNRSSVTTKPPAISSSSSNQQVKKQKPEVIIDAEKELERLLSPQKYDDKDEDDDDDDDNMNVDNNNDIESEDDLDYEMNIDTTMRKSAYMSEKSCKKKIYKDGEIVLSRPQRKDKGKPRFTAYMLWSKEVRQEMLKSNPNMDFSQASRRLSSMWAIVPNNEKNIWRRRAKRVTLKNKRALKTGEKLTTKYLNKPGQKKPGRKPKHFKDTMVTSASDTVTSALSSPSPTRKAKTERKTSATPAKAKKVDDAHAASSTSSLATTSTSKHRTISNSSSSNFSGTILPGAYKVTGIGPTDVAAHLKLLGDNLTIIGQRLKEHEVNKLNTFGSEAFGETPFDLRSLFFFFCLSPSR